MAEQRVQLFTSAGKLVVTASVDVKDGRWPESVKFAEQRYVLKDGRYVLINAEAEPTSVKVPEKAPEARAEK